METRKVPVSFRLSPLLLQRVREAAKARGVPVQEIVSRAIEEHLARQEQEAGGEILAPLLGQALRRELEAFLARFDRSLRSLIVKVGLAAETSTVLTLKVLATLLEAKEGRRLDREALQQLYDSAYHLAVKNFRAAERAPAQAEAAAAREKEA